MISPKLLKTLSTAQVNQALTDTLDDLAELFNEMRRRLRPSRTAATPAATLTIVEATNPAPAPTINGLDPEERIRPRRERKPKSTPPPPDITQLFEVDAEANQSDERNEAE